MSITTRLAWRNLWRHPRRTWLTMGAMVFSNVLLVFMISLQVGMYRLMIDNSLQALTGHLQVQAEGFKDDLKMRQTVPDIQALADTLRTDLGRDTVSARAMAFALASSEDRSFGVQVIGVDPEHEPLVSNLPGLVTDGRYLGDASAGEIVIGSVLARNLRVTVDDQITLLGSGYDGSFAAAIATVVGIFDSGVTEIDRAIAKVPITFFQDVFFMEGGGHQIVVTVPDLAEVEAYKSRMFEAIAGTPDATVYDWDALQPGLRQAIQADISSAFFMYAILVILVAFSVLNTQLMSVLERTREFGIVMSLGVSPGKLGKLVMLETGLMGIMGLIAGAVLGALFTLYFTVNGFSYPGMEEMAREFNLPAEIFPRVNLLTLFLGPLMVFVFTLLSAVYPALRLHWLHPVEAMRSA